MLQLLQIVQSILSSTRAGEIPITKLIDEVEHNAIRAACPLAIYFLLTTLIDKHSRVSCLLTSTHMFLLVDKHLRVHAR